MGVKTIAGTVKRVLASSGENAHVTAVEFVDSAGQTVKVNCDYFVNCGGPNVCNVNKLVDGVSPTLNDFILNEIHGKVVLKDVLEVVPNDAPMMIFDDPINLEWSPEEREMLAEMGPSEQRLLMTLPGGAHFRPYPGAVNSLIMLWEFAHLEGGVCEWWKVPEIPDDPVFVDYLYPELLIRALSQMVPRLDEYLGNIPSSTIIDGGYYTKAMDNLPLIGRLPGAPEGAYICAALSGYGIMAANAAGHLLASQIAGAGVDSSTSYNIDASSYESNFDPARFNDAQYVEKVKAGLVKGLQI